MSLMPRVLILVLVVCLMVSACGSDNQTSNVTANNTAVANGAQPTSTTSSPNSDGTTSSSSSNADDSNATLNNTASASSASNTNTNDSGNSDASQIPPLKLTPVISLPDPMLLSPRPNRNSAQGDLYVGTRAGQIWRLNKNADAQADLVLDISHLTETGCENGLLGMAFSPSGNSLYLSYTDLQQNSQIVQYPMSGQEVLEDQARTVLSVPQPACNHNGGAIAFGPDGYLWLGFGDGGGSDDQFGHGQNLDSLLGAMLRIDPSANTTQAEYSIPADNPFSRGGGLPEIWAYGARNPWRFSFDIETGNLWIGDVGQNEWEEVNVVQPNNQGSQGINLGWPLFEGNERFSGTDTPQNLRFPDFAYSHDHGCSITGGYVYRGSAIAGLYGTYVFGDYCESRLWGLRESASGGYEQFELGVAVPTATLVSFGQDAAGELYVLSFDDTVYRLDPAT